MRRPTVVTLVVSVCLAALVPTSLAAPASASTLHGRHGQPGTVKSTTIVARANGIERRLSDPVLIVSRSKAAPGKRQRVCSRDALFRGTPTTAAWRLVRAGRLSCITLGAHERRTIAIGARFGGLAIGVLYGTDMRITWRTLGGHLLGAVTVDFGQRRDYSCLAPLTGCAVMPNATGAHGVLFSAPAAPPATPTQPPAPPVEAPTYPSPGGSFPGGESSAPGVFFNGTIRSGQIACPVEGGSLTVSGPTIADGRRASHPATDYYRDTLWYWSTATGTWRQLATGATRNAPRASGVWTDLATGGAANPVTYTVATGFYYAVTQDIIDGWSDLDYTLAAPMTTDPTAFNCHA
jgi:hypothetical protein